MRRMGVFARGFVPAVCLLIACGGDDGGGSEGGDDGGGATEPDAAGGRNDGGGPVPDGGGRDSGGTPDASSLDASSDAAPDASADAAPGPVTVTVSLPPIPRAGKVVFFLRNDSSVIDVVVTGEDGRAQAMLDEPGVVVILFPEGIAPGGGPPTLYAYLAVPPGSEIFQGAQPIPELAATMTVNGPTVPDSIAYTAQTVCGRGSAAGPSIEVSLQFCPSQTHVLWTATFLQKGQLDLLTAFTPTVDVQTGAVTVGGEFRPDLEHTARFTGLPAATTGDMTYNVMGPHGPVQFGQEHLSLLVQNGSLSITDQLHDLRGLGLTGQQWLVLNTPLGLLDIVAWGDHDGASTVDVTDAVAPHVLTATFTVATATWRWTQDDIGSASMAHGFVGVGDAQTTTHYWNVIGPPDALALTLPRLPPPYDDLNVEPITSVPGGAGLILYRRTGGYQRFVSDFHAATSGGSGTAGERLSVSSGFVLVE
jgi:hypothetical protein